MGATKSELLIKRYSTVAKPGDSETSKSFFGNVFGLLKQTFQEWLQDKAPQLGAALAYYTVFSLAPLILVLLAVVGVIFRDDPAGTWNKITEQLSYFLDASAVQVVQHRATSVPAGQEYHRYDYRRCPRALWRKRRLWSTSGRLEHNLGCKS